MEDPALEIQTEEEDSFDEIQRMRAEFRADLARDYLTCIEEGHLIGLCLGQIIIDSEEHPMHPRNVNRRMEAELAARQVSPAA